MTALTNDQLRARKIVYSIIEGKYATPAEHIDAVMAELYEVREEERKEPSCVYEPLDKDNKETDK
jgi:hypothetical protein